MRAAGYGDKSAFSKRNPSGADLYLFGHWWCCETCWNYMIKHKIKNVYLLNNAHNIFNRDKRYKLMDKIEKKFKKGETIKLKDIVWKLTKGKVCKK